MQADERGTAGVGKGLGMRRSMFVVMVSLVLAVGGVQRCQEVEQKMEDEKTTRAFLAFVDGASRHKAERGSYEGISIDAGLISQAHVGERPLAVPNHLNEGVLEASFPFPSREACEAWLQKLAKSVKLVGPDFVPPEGYTRAIVPEPSEIPTCHDRRLTFIME